MYMQAFIDMHPIYAVLFFFSDEDETAGLLEDACTPIDQVLKNLTNGDITGPLKPIQGRWSYLLHL